MPATLPASYAARTAGRTRPMERSRFDPLTWPTRLVLGALGATLVLNVVAVVSDVSYHDLIQRLVSGGDVSLADAQAADDRQFTIADVQLAVFALTALAFVVWFYRAYENLPPAGRREPALGQRVGDRRVVRAVAEPGQAEVARERHLARQRSASHRSSSGPRPVPWVGTRPVVGALPCRWDLRAGGFPGIRRCVHARRACRHLEPPARQ